MVDSLPRKILDLSRLTLARWRRRARRSPFLWWSAAGITAAVAALQVTALDQRAAARRDAWGATVVVAVAKADLAVGDVVGPGDADVERWPVAVVPDGALGEVPVGRVVTAPVVAGEAVVERRLAPAGLSGVAALVPEHHRAIAVPSSVDGFGTGAPPLAPGDRVDVLATFDVTDGDAPPTAAVAERVLVVDVDGDGGTVTVAVPADVAPRVAFAVARGTVTLALAGA